MPPLYPPTFKLSNGFLFQPQKKAMPKKLYNRVILKFSLSSLLYLRDIRYALLHEKPSDYLIL